MQTITPQKVIRDIKVGKDIKLFKSSLDKDIKNYVKEKRPRPEDDLESDEDIYSLTLENVLGFILDFPHCTIASIIDFFSPESEGHYCLCFPCTDETLLYAINVSYKFGRILVYIMRMDQCRINVSLFSALDDCYRYDIPYTNKIDKYDSVHYIPMILEFDIPKEID